MLQKPAFLSASGLRASRCNEWHRYIALAFAIAMYGCGGGGGGSTGAPSPDVSVGGSVTGLVGSGLVLKNNGGDDFAVSGNGTFAFATRLAHNAAYNVSVASQPSNPSQTCSVAAGASTTGANNVRNISVVCITNSYTVSGVVSGLTGSGLVLQNSGGDDISIASNGAFVFSTPVASGADFAVTARSQPTSPNQLCAIANGAGKVATANIANVAVTCAVAAYAVNVSVTGLNGSGLVLQNNGGGNLNILANGEYRFLAPIVNGNAYAVTVLTQPTNVTQVCSLTNANGVIGNSHVTVGINCSTTAYAISGTVIGLMGSGLVLRNNGGNDLPINTSGLFTFSGAISSGGSYNVSVAAQPSNPFQTCAASNASGSIVNSGVINVLINCTSANHTIGGTVSGLAGSGLVLRNNGGDDLVISTNGSFTFTTPVASGSAFSVSTFSQPSSLSQTCTATANNGVMLNADITTVQINCVTNKFGVGVTVSGLMGGSVVLQNGVDDLLTVATNGPATFAKTVASGAPFDVRVLTQPSNPNQICKISNGTGTVGNGSVSGPSIECATQFPRYVLSLDYNDDSISHYALDAATGILRRNGYANTGSRPTRFVRDSSAKFTYVLNRGSATISAYAHNAVTSDDREISGSPYSTGGIANLSLGGDGSNGLTAHPSKPFLYVSNASGAGANTVAAFSIDSTTGALTPLTSSPYSTGVRPSGLTIDALGKFLYVVNIDSRRVYVYAIDQTTGELNEVPISRVPTGTTPAGELVLHPSGRFAYVGNTGSASLSVYTVNTTTGILTPVSGSPYFTGANTGAEIWIHPNGKFVYARNAGPLNAATGSISAFAINQSTGALTPLVGSPYSTGMNSLTSRLDPAGRFLYVVNRGLTTLTGSSSTGSISAFAIDAATGVLTAVLGSPFTLSPAPTSINIDATGQFAYAVSSEGNLAYSFAVNQSNGALAPLAGAAKLVTREQPISISSLTEPLTPTPAVFSSKYAYVPNQSDSTVTSYFITGNTGAISATSTVNSAGAFPTGVALHPSGTRLYVSIAGTPAVGVSSHAINGLDGTLSVSSNSVATPNAATVLRTLPNGRGAYVAISASNGLFAYGIDATTNTIGAISGGGSSNVSTVGPITGLAMSPHGRFLYYVANAAWGFAPIDSGNGAFSGASSSQVTGATSKNAIVIEPSGRYAYIAIATAPTGGVEVLPIDPLTGALGAIAQTAPTGSTPGALAADPTGRFLYVANSGSNTVSTFAINQSNGQLTEILPRKAAGTNPSSLSVDFAGKYLYAISQATKEVLGFEIDQTTGALTALATIPGATGNAPSDIVLSKDFQ